MSRDIFVCFYFRSLKSINIDNQCFQVALRIFINNNYSTNKSALKDVKNLLQSSDYYEHQEMLISIKHANIP